LPFLTLIPPLLILFRDWLPENCGKVSIGHKWIVLLHFRKSELEISGGELA